MNYSFDGTARFYAALATLPSWLQEEALDEAERLLAEGKQIQPRRGQREVIRDFTRLAGGRIHYVFLTIHADHVAGKLTITDIGYFHR